MRSARREERLERIGEELRLLESNGPWPFITRHILEGPDGVRIILHARHHRKEIRRKEFDRLLPTGVKLLECLWMPSQLNWWIGAVFALGATLFALGSLFILVPDFASNWSMDADAINRTFFAGSIPFTIAAYLQLFQSANAREFTPHDGGRPERVQVFGWRPNSIGWISSVLQFIGTILFNFNTFDAMIPGLNWFQQDLLIWIPNIAGSILFLASGYLAFAETCHAYWAWDFRNLSWWITATNLFGCVAFIISAVFAFVPQTAPSFDAQTTSVVFTFLGAMGFFAGSFLMLPEAVFPAEGS